MTTAEIPRREWSSFLEAFSRQHHGWLVQIDGDLPEPAGAAPLPLEAVTTQLVDDRMALSVVMREPKSPQRHVVHTISTASGLTVEERDGGAEKRLLVQSGGAGSTVIRLHQAVQPPI